MAKIKRNTVRKGMSLREYINFVNYLETNELEMDLTECDPVALAKIEVRVMRLSSEEKQKMDDFFADKPLGISAKSIYDSIPKIKRPVQVAPAVLDETAPDKTDVMKLGPANITSTDQFDYVGLVKMVEQGDLNFKGVVKLLDTQYVSANKLLSVPVPPEVKALRKSYSNYENMIGIIQGAEDIAKRIYDIMNAPEPPEEETFDRFKNYVLHSREEAKSQTIEQYSLECDEVESVEGDKIMFNAALDKFIQYSNASEMKDDILFLIKKRKLDLDAEIDVLGKSTSGRKIIAQLMRKYPNGLPGCAAFYRTTKEALLAGVMEF